MTELDKLQADLKAIEGLSEETKNHFTTSTVRGVTVALKHRIAELEKAAADPHHIAKTIIKTIREKRSEWCTAGNETRYIFAYIDYLEAQAAPTLTKDGKARPKFDFGERVKTDLGHIGNIIAIRWKYGRDPKWAYWIQVGSSGEALIDENEITTRIENTDAK